MTLLGRYFQIHDDYQILVSADYSEANASVKTVTKVNSLWR